VNFTPTPLTGAYVIDIEPLGDARGFFARTVADDAFAAHGLSVAFVQQSVSWNPQIGTLRGLHYQIAPHEEDKLVRATRGAIFDVIVDLRRGSDTYGKWFGVELSADNRRQLYIPRGFAHGFQTTLPDTEISYQMTVPFHPNAARGLRWNDPRLAIDWPSPASAVISPKDQALPGLYG
jgi:dTDP-4-dehydrorhamnose 3,5-epimerase